MKQQWTLRRKLYNGGMRGLVWLCAGLTCALLIFLIGYIFYRGVPGLSWQLISGQTSYIRNTVGILPNLLNTLYIILVAMVVVLPLGVGAGHLPDGVCRQRAAGPHHRVRRRDPDGHSLHHLRTGGHDAVRAEAGPSGGNSGRQPDAGDDDPAHHHPHHAGEPENRPPVLPGGALALGAGKWHMVRTVVLPGAVDGIVTGCILAIGRIVGESAALLYTAGFGMALVSLFDSLHTSSATLTVALYVYATEGGETALAFSIATILMVLTLLINLTAGIIGRKLKRK